MRPNGSSLGALSNGLRMNHPRIASHDLSVAVADFLRLMQVFGMEFWENYLKRSIFAPPETSNPPGCAVLTGSVEGVVA